MFQKKGHAGFLLQKMFLVCQFRSIFFPDIKYFKTYLCGTYICEITIGCINNHHLPGKLHNGTESWQKNKRYEDGWFSISKTPDTTAKIAFTDNNTKFAQDGVQ